MSHRTPAPPALSDAIQIRGARQNNLQGHRSRSAARQAERHHRARAAAASRRSPSTRSTPRASGATSRRSRPTRGSSSSAWTSRRWMRSTASRRPSPSSRSNNIRSTRSHRRHDHGDQRLPEAALPAPRGRRPAPSAAAPVKPETRGEHPARAAARARGRDRAHHSSACPCPRRRARRTSSPSSKRRATCACCSSARSIRTDEPAAFGRRKLPAVVHVIQDRVTLDETNRSRLTEAIETALRFGKGTMSAASRSSELQSQSSIISFSTDWHCADCDIKLPAPTPGLFSFNNPIGACPTCRGFGRTLGLDMTKAMPDESLSIREGLVKAFSGESYRECQRDLDHGAPRHAASISTGPSTSSARPIGTGSSTATGSDPEEAYNSGEWYGVRASSTGWNRSAYKMHVRVFLSRYRTYTDVRRLPRRPPQAGGAATSASRARRCPISGGCRCAICSPLLRALARRASMTTPRACCATRSPRASATSSASASAISNLDRPTRTLSGGEVERVNLTTCLGASLVNTLFVLDEPSIGLHPRDTGRLIGVMERPARQGQHAARRRARGSRDARRGQPRRDRPRPRREGRRTGLQRPARARLLATKADAARSLTATTSSAAKVDPGAGETPQAAKRGHALRIIGARAAQPARTSTWTSRSASSAASPACRGSRQKHARPRRALPKPPAPARRSHARTSPAA